MSYTLEELRSAIEASDIYYNSWYWFYNNDQELPEIGTAKEVDRYGGEGQGDDLWVVFKVEPADGSDVRYFRKSGYHQSHDGSYFDGELEEVVPFEKTVTDYKAV